MKFIRFLINTLNKDSSSIEFCSGPVPPFLRFYPSLINLLLRYVILTINLMTEVNAVEEPIDLVLMSLKEKVYVKCRHGRELKGRLVVIILLIAKSFMYRHMMNI